MNKEQETPSIGDHVFKTAMTTLVCCKCLVQVEISDIQKNGIPKYKCPKCKKERTPMKTWRSSATAIYLDYVPAIIHYKKVKVF